MTLADGDWLTDDTRALVSAFLSLRTEQETAGFLRDLCTRRELEEMAHRWAVVRLLDEGLPYREVAQRTGASTTTITRINEWLQHGTGGYRTALDRTSPRPRRRS